MNLANLFANSKYARDYSAGTTIFAQGEPGDLMYVVLEGELDIQRGGQTLATAPAGAIVGEMALIDKGSPRTATVIAKTDCRLVPIDERRFEWMVTETPSFAVHLMRLLVDRLRRTTERITSA
jgi:CRP-like cAMP-binding protein